MTRNGATNLWEQPLSRGKPKQLTQFSSGQIFDFSWSADHARLLLARRQSSRDVVLIGDDQKTLKWSESLPAGVGQTRLRPCRTFFVGRRTLVDCTLQTLGRHQLCTLQLPKNRELFSDLANCSL